MKKILAIVFSLILVSLAMPATCFAESYVIDSFTGDVIGETNEQGEVVNQDTLWLNSNVAYRMSDKSYIYYLDETSNSCVFVDVYNLEFSTNPVNVSTNGNFAVDIYKDGILYDSTNMRELTEPGGYSVTMSGGGVVLCSFTILPALVGDINYFELPYMYTIASMKLNGKDVSLNNYSAVNIVDEGEYEIIVYNNIDGSLRYLEFVTDHTPPVLEIIGIDENHQAKNPVSFGQLEPESKIRILYEGEEIQAKDSYKDRGNYSVEYTDAAGNTSISQFRINTFLDVSTWIIVVIGIVSMGAAVAYLIYNRNHLRVS